MRKTMLFAVFLLFAGAMSGCRNNIEEREDVHGAKMQEDMREEFIMMKDTITELESGFFVVSLKGNYGFDDFLKQGGAKSDAEVLKYLTGMLLGETDGLSFEGTPFGCSSLSAKNIEGGYYFGRNFDWNACDALVLASYPEKGYASFSTVNLDFVRQGAGAVSHFLSDETIAAAALYAPLDGMNEKGLCVSVNMIQDEDTISQNTDKPDITTTTAVRLLLNEAADTEEAVELLNQYDFHASMDYMVHLAIADSKGKSVAVEFVNNEMQVIDTPVLTNYYLAEGEKKGIGTEQSHKRFTILKNVLQEKDKMDEQQVRDALSSVSKKISANLNLRNGVSYLTRLHLLLITTIGKIMIRHLHSVCLNR